MAIVSIKNKSKYGEVLAGNTPPGRGFTLLNSVTLSTSQGSVEFNSIPNTYTHLQIRTFARSDRSGAVSSGNLRIRFNSDSSTIYPMHCLEGSGSSASATAVTNETGGWAAFTLAVANHSANVMGAGIIDILDYANTNKYKTIRTLGGVDNNGNGTIGLSSSLWQSTSAITSITLTSRESTNLVAPSHFALYGILGV